MASALALTDFEAEAYEAIFRVLHVSDGGGGDAVPAAAAADLFRTSLLPSVVLKEVGRRAVPARALPRRATQGPTHPDTRRTG